MSVGFQADELLVLRTIHSTWKISARRAYGYRELLFIPSLLCQLAGDHRRQPPGGQKLRSAQTDVFSPSGVTGWGGSLSAVMLATVALVSAVSLAIGESRNLRILQHPSQSWRR